ncbi:MAG: hypothetical protein M0Z30_12945, partial [Actinomycetota bacterium]|nr:hypothetical protein [Actinomycetota bacterium]
STPPPAAVPHLRLQYPTSGCSTPPPAAVPHLRLQYPTSGCSTARGSGRRPRPRRSARRPAVSSCARETEFSCVTTSDSPGHSGPALLDRLVVAVVGGPKRVGIRAHTRRHDFSPPGVPALSGHLTGAQRCRGERR